MLSRSFPFSEDVALLMSLSSHYFLTKVEYARMQKDMEIRSVEAPYLSRSGTPAYICFRTVPQILKSMVNATLMSTASHDKVG